MVTTPDNNKNEHEEIYSEYPVFSLREQVSVIQAFESILVIRVPV
jgi:hypothetical protein